MRNLFSIFLLSVNAVFQRTQSTDEDKCLLLKLTDLPKIDSSIQLDKILENRIAYKNAMQRGRRIYNIINAFILDPSRHHLVWSQIEREWCSVDR